jgi:hypothetical protein
MSYPEVRFVTEMMAGTESFTFCVPKEIAAPTGTGGEYNRNITHRSEAASNTLEDADERVPSKVVQRGLSAPLPDPAAAAVKLDNVSIKICQC